MKKIQHPGFMNELEPIGNLPMFPAFPRKKVGPRTEDKPVFVAPENPNVRVGLDGKLETKLVYATSELREIHGLPAVEEKATVKRVRKVSPMADIADGVYALNNDMGELLGYVAVIEGIGHFPGTGYTRPAKSISLAIDLITGTHCQMYMGNASSHGFYLWQQQRNLVDGVPKFIDGVYKTLFGTTPSWFAVRGGVRYKYRGCLEDVLSSLQGTPSGSMESQVLPSGIATFVQPLPSRPT